MFTVKLQNWTINTPGRPKKKKGDILVFLFNWRCLITPTPHQHWQWHLSESISTGRDDLPDLEHQLTARLVTNCTGAIFRLAANWKTASADRWHLLLLVRWFGYFSSVLIVGDLSFSIISCVKLIGFVWIRFFFNSSIPNRGSHLYYNSIKTPACLKGYVLNSFICCTGEMKNRLLVPGRVLERE